MAINQTANEISSRIIRRLSATDSALNTDIGTPVRKIIDAVSFEMLAYREDVELATYQFNVDKYSGNDLDDLVRLFGFARQQSKSATGFVTIERDNSDSDVVISYGTSFFKPASGDTKSIYFYAITDSVISVGQSKVDVPVVASMAGNSGNVAPMSVTSTTGYTTSYRIYNKLAMLGGVDHETDDQLRSRFKSTVFRAVTGTIDQYIAIADTHVGVENAKLFSKTNHGTETLTVVDDGGTVDPYVETRCADIKGVPMYYNIETSLYEPRSIWVTNNDTSDQLMRGIDFIATYATGVIAVTFQSFDVVAESVASFLDEAFDLSNRNLVAGSVTVSASNNMASPLIEDTDYTIDYVNGTITKINAALPNQLFVSYSYRSIGVGDVASVEYDYESTLNDTQHDATLIVKTSSAGASSATDTRFLNLPNALRVTLDNQSWWMRADGSAPVIGNYISVLANQPAVSVLDTMTVGNGAISSGFRLVRDVGALGNSRFALDAIEIDQAEFDNPSTTWRVSTDYIYDASIEKIQNDVDKYTQVSTSVLVRGAKKRYFKLAFTIISSVYPRDSIVSAVETAVADYFSRCGVGGVLQVSDIELAISLVSGVDSVRLAVSGDGAVYGITEYQEDLSTAIGSTVGSDIILGSAETPVLSGVTVHLRTQEVW